MSEMNETEREALRRELAKPPKIDVDAIKHAYGLPMDEPLPPGRYVAPASKNAETNEDQDTPDLREGYHLGYLAALFEVQEILMRNEEVTLEAVMEIHDVQVEVRAGETAADALNQKGT